jgi:hypothetical protein
MIARKLISLLILTLTATVAFAKSDRLEPVAKMNPSASGISWQPSVDHEKMVLTIIAPDGTRYAKEFASGNAPLFRLQDLPGKAGDGVYQFELRLIPRISNEVKRQLAAARAADDDATIQKIQHANGIDRGVSQSGTLTVVNGSFVNSDSDEPASHASVLRTAAAASTTPSNDPNVSAMYRGRVTPFNQVVADNQIVQGSLCVGFDCTTTESFGFETIKTKENNTRLLFDDTSTSAGFPNVDWQLVANDSGSGGANKFTIQDVTNSKNILEVMATAPTDSIFVATSGKVGFGNAAPGLNLHITATDTPAIRQEQTSGGGFTAQTWDIGANEANWFVRDVTGGSRLPLRIRPGAPTSSIDIAASGNVGAGTASPTERLHVYNNADSQTIIMAENPATTSNAASILRAKSDTAQVHLTAHSSTRTITRFGQSTAGWNELIQVSGNGLMLGTTTAVPLIIGTNNTNRLQIDSSGNVTVTGNFSVTGTKNFAVPDPQNAKRALYFAALEGPEAGTYFRGTAKTVNGEAVIELPGYFSRITERERMTVQLTPIGAPGQLYISEKSPERVIIKAADGAKDVEFDYFVQGVRKGYLDYQVERDNNLPN